MDDATEAAREAPEASRVVQRASRPLEEAWVGGVCAGLASNLGWPVLGVRAAFVALGAVQFLGVAAYLILWLALPPAGLRQASRRGTDSSDRAAATGSSPRNWIADLGQGLALALLGVGLVALQPLLGLGIGLAWTAAGALASLGLFALWSASDQMSTRLVGAGVRRRWVLLTPGGWLLWLRIVVGLVLLTGAGWLALVLIAPRGWEATMWIVALVVSGLGLALVPVGNQVRFALSAEREARLIADAQADVAAHLHDSVLQTLALIQRQADDRQRVAKLARRQERELREWLYGDTITDPTLAAAMKRVAADIEDAHGASVELVLVGDTPLTESLEAVVRAAGEAIANAAKHSGQGVVDVYAEADEGQVEVFVRDRGVGFDVESVAADRQGVRRSILDRMARHGGRAQVKSALGEGTEVRLEMRIT